MKTRSMRGDLSAPVLAIIVTIGIIAAGLVLLAWFWWFAPQAGKAGTLQILGQPSLIYTSKNETHYNYTVYISVRNTGNDPVTITGLTVDLISCTGLALDIGGTTLNPGASGVLKATCTFEIEKKPTSYTVPGIIQTNYGTYTVNLAVIGAPS